MYGFFKWTNLIKTAIFHLGPQTTPLNLGVIDFDIPQWSRLQNKMKNGFSEKKNVKICSLDVFKSVVANETMQLLVWFIIRVAHF